MPADSLEVVTYSILYYPIQPYLGIEICCDGNPVVSSHIATVTTIIIMDYSAFGSSFAI